MIDSRIDPDQSLRELAEQRLKRLRETMRAMDTEVMLILDSVNIQYATGATNMTIFSTRTPARYLLLCADGPCVLFDYFGCEHLAEPFATIDEIRPARGLCHVSSGADAAGQANAFADEIVAVLGDSGVSVARLAVDRFPFVAIDALRARGFQLHDADPVLAAARRIKLSAEIEMMREAMRRVTAATAQMAAHIEPGRRETDVWADFIGPFMADEGRYVTTRLVQSGDRSFPYFQEAGARRIDSGDLLCFDTDAVGYAGYCVDFSRSFLCGDEAPSDRQVELYTRAYEQLEHNIELIRPGAGFRDIAAAAWQVPSEHQDSRYYCVAHGLGMSGEFPNIPHLRAGQSYPIDGVLEAGMVMCVESYIGCARTRQGVKLEEQLLLTDSGFERMSAGVPFEPRLMSQSF